MKILCNYTPCGPAYVRSGWGRVLRAMGHEFLFWDQCRNKSAFDIFSEFEPDLYIGTTYETDRSVYKNIVYRPNMKVILYASAWGPYLDSVDLVKYPLVVANEKEKKIIESLKKETGKPDFVFIHAHDRWLEGTMSGWGSIGVKYIGALNAADTFVYLDGKKQEELKCDIGFVGGYWGYKARNLDKYMLPMCHKDAGFKIKIFGNQPWPIHQYLGGIDDKDSTNLFASATVCPSISEPHSTDYGWDVIERPFKVFSAGGFCISDYVEEARALFTEDELLMPKTPKEFHETVRHFVANPDDRIPFQEKARKKVLEKHTYFDRIEQFFENLNMSSEVERVRGCKKHFLRIEN